MEILPITMKLEDMSSIPEHKLPQGYYLRKYLPGDEKHWVDIELSVGSFKSKEEAERKFAESFRGDVEELKRRQLYLCTQQGEIVGTATAWMTDRFEENMQGLVHWVAIKPEHQAKKLGRPLVYSVLELMRTWHSAAYLNTETNLHRALRIYLEMGFRPFMTSDDSPRAWQIAAAGVRHPALEQYRQI